MKNFMAKLKNVDYKQAAVDHAEKAVLALVGVLVLTSLACTRWSRYSTAPEEFLTKVADGTSQLQASVWPEEKRAEFESARDLTAAVSQLFSPVAVAGFEYRLPFYQPLYPQKEKIKEPVWVAVQELIATPGKVILEFRPEGSATDTLLAGTSTETSDTATEADANPSKSPKEPDIVFDDETAPRETVAARPGAMSGMAPGMSADAYERQMAADYEREEMGSGTDVNEETEEMYSGMYESGSMGGMVPRSMGRDLNARGLRYVAVRGVFPFEEQAKGIRSALNLDTTEEAYQYVEFIEFVIERQAAVGGEDPWLGEWETLGIQSALDVLDTVTDFDADVVDAAYTDSVFTMPLPRRVAGSWSRRGSHKRIKELTEEEAERQMEINRKALEKMEELRSQQPVKRGGFAERQHNMRGIRSQLNTRGMMESVMDDAYDEYSDEDYQPYNERMGSMPRGNLNKAAFGSRFQATGARYLLFRYLDFDVEPGNAYRYRVQLVLRNPNYRRPVEELLDSGFADGETRTTPVSKSSDVAIVPKDVNYYLTRVSDTRGETVAEFDIYRWYPDAGTIINGTVKPVVPGDRIGGAVTAEVLRPEESLREETDVPLTTDDILLDIAESPQLASGEHPDLVFDTKRRGPAPDFARALVLDRYGEVVSLDQFTKERNRLAEQQRIQRQNTPWEHLKEQEKDAMSALDELGSGYYDEGDMEEEYMSQGSSSGRSRQSGRSSRSRRGRGNPSRRPSGGVSSMVPGSYLEK